MPRSAIVATLATFLAATQAAAQPAPPTSGQAGTPPAPDWSALERARTHAPRPTTTAITVEDLRTRVFGFADDSMRGRVIADRGNVMGTRYIAAELRRLGLEPAGDNGGYFQLVPIVERAFDPGSRLRIGDQALVAWKDYVMRDQGGGQRSIDGVPVVYGGVWGDEGNMLPRAAATGKVVILSVRPGDATSGIPGIPNRQQVNAYYASAAALMVIGVAALPQQFLAIYQQPTGGLRETNPAPIASYYYITPEVARAALGADVTELQAGAAGTAFTGNPAWVERLAPEPTYNVVGIVRGSDPTLRNEYVAIGAHNDHVGTDPEPAAHDSIYVVNHLFRQQGADDAPPRLSPEDAARVNSILADVRRRTNGASARMDSVYNGADDDASGSMGVLEMAEYFAGQATKPKRSLLFVWHVAEEAGLFGSKHFADNPTVPRESIVAQLNLDMVGRGTAADVTGVTKDGAQIRGRDGYVQLIGSRRLSTELGDLVERVNTTKGHRMALDYALDANGHPQNIYCRSDHYEYAKWGIPVTFFTTGGHADYHQLTDEPQYVNYEQLRRVTSFVGDVAMETANLARRPAVDKPRPNPNAPCQQ